MNAEEKKQAATKILGFIFDGNPYGAYLDDVQRTAFETQIGLDLDENGWDMKRVDESGEAQTAPSKEDLKKDFPRTTKQIGRFLGSIFGFAPEEVDAVVSQNN